MKIKINYEKETVTYFFRNAIKVVVYCKSRIIKKFKKGVFCNKFYVEDCPPEVIPSYVKCISKYSHPKR